MPKSSETFNKKEKEKKRLQKRKEKEQRKEERKANNGKDGKSFEDMIAYVDENGNLTSTPPDVTKKRQIKEGDIDLTSKNKGGRPSPLPRQGVVKFFDTSKGFGFIRDESTQEELFFHYKAANFPIAQNDRVTFETEMGPKGLNAVRITKG